MSFWVVTLTQMVTSFSSNNRFATFNNIDDAESIINYFNDYEIGKYILKVTYTNQSASQYKKHTSEDDEYYASLYGKLDPR